MTDTTVFYRTVIAQVTQFVKAYEDLKVLSDRIAADSALSGQAATAAQAGGRSDLTAASFDNLKVAADLIESLLSANTGANVPVSINTGGKVKLALYKLL